MSCPSSSTEVNWESTLWSPNLLTKEFDWECASVFPTMEPDELTIVLPQYFELENCDETLGKAIFIDFCIDVIGFVSAQQFSTPGSLYFMNLMLKFYKEAGSTTLEQCVLVLRSQLLAASSLSTSPKPTVIQMDPAPQVPPTPPPEEIPPEEPAPKEKNEKGKKTGKTNKKTSKAEKEKEEEKQEIKEEIPLVEITKQNVNEGIPVEVVLSPSEIENAIRYVTTGFLRHFKLYKYVTTHPRRCVPKQTVTRQIVTPAKLVPFSEAHPKPPTPPPSPTEEEHKETPEERVQRLVTEAITKSLQDSKEELSVLLLRHKETIMKKISQQLGISMNELNASSQSTSRSPSPQPSPTNEADTDGEAAPSPQTKKKKKSK